MIKYLKQISTDSDEFMSITLSDKAAARIHQFLSQEAEDGHARAFRLGVKRTGCSGWAYVTSITSEINSDDQRFEDHGIPIVVDPKSLELVDGTRIDFEQQGLNELFTFTNPNVTDECGCGESFAVNKTTKPSAGAPANPF